MQREELKAARERLGLSQDEFAEALGLSRVFVGMMERGDKAIEKRTELAVLFLLRLRRDPPQRLRLRASDVDWQPRGDGWFGEIGPFDAVLSPETKGRWRIALVQRELPHYRPTWPMWEASLENAKGAALLNAQHGMLDLEDIQEG